MTTTASPLQVLPAPRHTPPGEPLPTHAQGGRPIRPGATPYVQDALAVDFAAASDEQVFGPQVTRAHELPDPRRWAAHIAQGLVEVMHGVRPPSQVMRWTTPEVYAVVGQLGGGGAARGDGAPRAVPPTEPGCCASTCASPPTTSPRPRSCSSTAGGCALWPCGSSDGTTAGSSRHCRSAEDPAATGHTRRCPRPDIRSGAPRPLPHACGNGQRPFLAAFFDFLAAARRSARVPQVGLPSSCSSTPPSSDGAE